jgi:spoIIIJ-associated protein
MTAKDSIEVTGATIDEAISQALSELGVAEDDAVIEVMVTPRSGVLGLGSRQARVRVSRRHGQGEAQSPAAPSRPSRPASVPSAPEEQGRSPAPEAPRPRPSAPPESNSEEEAGDAGRRPAGMEEQESEAIRMLAQILELMGEKAEVRLVATDPEAIELEIKGDGSGILIGRHGQTLDALEYLLNRLLARKIMDAVAVVIDTERYRARRRHLLERIALAMGERVKRERIKMVMEPMAPRDRRVVHLALKDDPLLITRSTGAGYMRTVEIVPAEGRHERDGRSRQREREVEAPIGEQGGFKRGQKRIV